MVLKNHIANRFLTDDTLMMEMIETFYPVEFRKLLTSEDEITSLDPKVEGLYRFLSSDGQKPYYITSTVIDKLEMLKINKKNTEGIGEHYDWTYFKNLKNQKVTFIFPENCLLRFSIIDDTLHFCFMNFKSDKGKDTGQLLWTMFYVNRNTGEQCEHFSHDDVKAVELFIYRVLCFFYLSKNEMIIVNPGMKYGTRREGKFINSFDKIPVTIVNSSWNVTSIRTEGFDVCGHFALRWSGEGRLIPKMVFIEPFKKHGYVRGAGKENHKILNRDLEL